MEKNKLSITEEYNQLSKIIDKRFISLLRPINKTFLIGKYVNDIDGNCIKITDIDDNKIIGTYYRNPATITTKPEYISTESKINILEMFDNLQGNCM